MTLVSTGEGARQRSTASAGAGPLRLQGIAVALPLDPCEPATSSSATFTVSPSSVSSSVYRHPLRPVVKRPTAACSSSGSNLNLLIP
nr:hypothetical protein Itr_chr05CG05120 [Ipomoea trifida]